MHFALEARLGVDVGLVLRDVGELAIDRKSVAVVAQRRIALESNHSLGDHAFARHCALIVAVLGPEREPGLLRRSEGVEALDSPFKLACYAALGQRDGKGSFS